MKRDMPKVSVVIPTYNREKYIEKTLQSVFDQTYTDYEVIVVDDGSTDNTAEVIKPYLSMLTYIRKENGGQASARNAGIERARGEYIAFLDSDDLWMPEKLDLQVKFLDEHPDIGLVFGNEIIFYEDDRGEDIEIDRLVIREKDLSFKRLFQSNLVPTSTVMVRKICLENCGLFNESEELRKGGQDYELWLRIAMRYRLGHISKVLGKYRQHVKNVVGTDMEKVYASHLRAIHSILARYPDIPEEFDIDMNEYYRNFYYCSGRNLFQNKRYWPAVKYLRQALYYKPFAPKALILFSLSFAGGLVRMKRGIEVT